MFTRTFPHFLVECLIFLLLFDLVACGTSSGVTSGGSTTSGTTGLTDASTDARSKQTNESRPELLANERQRNFKILNLLSPDLSAELSKESRVHFSRKAVPVRVASDRAAVDVVNPVRVESVRRVESVKAVESNVVKSTNARNNGESSYPNEASSQATEDSEANGRESDKKASAETRSSARRPNKSKQSDGSESMELTGKPTLSAESSSESSNTISERSLIKNHLLVRLAGLKEACRSLLLDLNASSPLDKFDTNDKLGKLGKVLINFLNTKTIELTGSRWNESAKNSFNLLRTKLIKCVGKANFRRLKRFLVVPKPFSKKDKVSLDQASLGEESSNFDETSLRNDATSLENERNAPKAADRESNSGQASQKSSRDRRQIKNSTFSIGHDSSSKSDPNEVPPTQNSSSISFFTFLVNKFLDLKIKKSKRVQDEATGRNTSDRTEKDSLEQRNVHLDRHPGDALNKDHRPDDQPDARQLQSDRRLVHNLKQLNNREILSQVLEKDGNITKLLLKNNLTEDDLLNRTNPLLTSVADLFVQIQNYKDLDVENFKPSNSCRNYVRNSLYFLCDGESFTEVPQLVAAVETL